MSVEAVTEAGVCGFILQANKAAGPFFSTAPGPQIKHHMAYTK